MSSILLAVIGSEVKVINRSLCDILLKHSTHMFQILNNQKIVNRKVLSAPGRQSQSDLLSVDTEPRNKV